MIESFVQEEDAREPLECLEVIEFRGECWTLCHRLANKVNDFEVLFDFLTKLFLIQQFSLLFLWLLLGLTNFKIPGFTSLFVRFLFFYGLKFNFFKASINWLMNFLIAGFDWLILFGWIWRRENWFFCNLLLRLFSVADLIGLIASNLFLLLLFLVYKCI